MARFINLRYRGCVLTQRIMPMVSEPSREPAAQHGVSHYMGIRVLPRSILFSAAVHTPIATLVEQTIHPICAYATEIEPEGSMLVMLALLRYGGAYALPAVDQ